MNYLDGREIRFGDQVEVSDDPTGLVVACIETGLYAPEVPGSKWSYLKRGVLVRSEKYGLIHYEQPDEDLKLLERKAGERC